MNRTREEKEIIKNKELDTYYDTHFSYYTYRNIPYHDTHFSNHIGIFSN